MSRSRKLRLPGEPVELGIDSLSHDGRGVGRIEGKAVFVGGALPGERVRARIVAKHKTYDEAVVETVLDASSLRAQPRCAHAGVCGGCSLQHLAPEAQIDAKQQVLLDNFTRIGKVEAQALLPPLRGPQWGYRTRARLGAKYVRKMQRALVGFREKHKPHLAELTRCEVLHPVIGERITELAELLADLDARERIPQIEIAVGDGAGEGLEVAAAVAAADDVLVEVLVGGGHCGRGRESASPRSALRRVDGGFAEVGDEGVDHPLGGGPGAIGGADRLDDVLEDGRTAGHAAGTAGCPAEIGVVGGEGVEG